MRVSIPTLTVLLSLPGLALPASPDAVAAATPALQSAPLTTRDDFCVGVQQRLAGTARVARNTVHRDYPAFKASKPAVDPLETHQFVLRDSGAGDAPLRISCKTKTADHLNEVYGAGTALPSPSVSCRQINRETILGIWRELSPAERSAARRPPTQIMLDPDAVTITGSSWIEPYAFVYTGADGKLHVLAKALRVAWNEWPWKIAPARLRGTYYCHLLAPEYARRLISGESDPAPLAVSN